MDAEGKGSFWPVGTTILAGLSLVLVIANVALVLRNQSIQAVVGERQQTINQGLEYARIRQVLAQNVANVATAKKDAELSEVLARHGITLASPAAPSAPAAPQGK